MRADAQEIAVDGDHAVRGDAALARDEDLEPRHVETPVRAHARQCPGRTPAAEVAGQRAAHVATSREAEAGR